MHLLDIFYPRRCKYCGSVIDLRRDICVNCENSLKEITGEICTHCGAEKQKCFCKDKKLFYKSVCAPFYYDGAASKAIWNLKFKSMPEFADVLAEDMVACFKAHYGNYSFDYCTFVPSVKKDVKKRGFNHAELLARKFSETANIPCEEFLIKCTNTQPQHTLPEMQRSGNLLGCFDTINTEKMKNARILLCDDVKTTGTTLNECAKTLLIGGAAEVLCLTAAITLPKSKK